MNKKHEFTLQIIIGTYNRTEAAIRCIKSALPLLELGVGIAVHSNSPDQKLRYFMQSNGLSKYYGEHITNMGGMGNLRSLMKIVDSKYVIMMSDEDELRPEKFKTILKKINEQETEYFALSKIENYFDTAEDKDRTFNRAEALTRFSWALTYMSGFMFPTSIYKDEHIEGLLKDCVYCHLVYKMMIKNNQKLIIPAEPYIIKNDDVKIGGHSYEHVSHDDKTTEILQNPMVFGYEARISQFYNLAHFQLKFGIKGIRQVFILSELLSIWSSSYHQAARLCNDVMPTSVLSANFHKKYYQRWPSNKILHIVFRILCSKIVYNLGLTRIYSNFHKFIRIYIFRIYWS
jgi:hypothetical protein